MPFPITKGGYSFLDNLEKGHCNSQHIVLTVMCSNVNCMGGLKDMCGLSGKSTDKT